MATVQQNSQAIVDLEGGAQAMWTVKAQAGDITAGIGLIADQETGQSQVLVNASQFFVFDNAVGKTAVFAIDQGQVIIQDAVIRKATIDILNTETITATNVKAGQAGFGAGGGYPMFGSSWHTTIDSTGTVRTNKLQAEGGYVRNMTIGNCTIEQDCVVRGTVYAERIQGDVAATRSLPNNGALTVLPSAYVREIYVSTFIAAGRYGSHINILVNGISIGSLSVSPLIGGQAGAIADMKSAVFTYTIPANVQVTISSSANIPNYSTATALVTVQKQDSSTFA
jgi:hypothetical protein